MMKNKFILIMINVLIVLSLNVFSQHPVCNSPINTNDFEYTKLGIHSGIYDASLNSLGAQCVWAITKGCPDIIVGVVDTEFDTGHEDLVNTFEGVVDTQTYIKNHGTMVSGMVATGTNNGIGIAGIGYNTRVRGYHAHGDDVWDRAWDAYNDGIKIINMSWININGSYNPIRLQQMIDDGVTIILGAGNDIVGSYHSLYADIPGVINVSGVNEHGYHGPTNTARNRWVDVCGVVHPLTVCKPFYDGVWEPECVSTPTGRWYCADGTVSQGHTSLAAPQVAGVVALMRSVNSFLSAAQIEDIIKTTGKPILDGHLFIGHDTQGIPRPRIVNAYAAVLEAKRLACGSTNTFSKNIQTINESVNGGHVIISNTTVASGRRLSVRACNSVTINGPFLVEAGGMLNINVSP